ncbi:MAG: hypothetical protein IPL39_04620 [Opitutaceae bacterium]|nr:hypothetical protein [Opitutaceae bacterium]
MLGIATVPILAALSFWGWTLFRDHLGDSQVLAALNEQIGAGKIRFEKVALSTVASTDQERTLHFKADGVLAQDLLVRQPTDIVLRAKFADDLDRLESLAHELATPAGAHLVELAALGSAPADPLTLVFLEKSASAGTRVACTGTVAATRGPDGWKLETAPEEFTPPLPLGKPRALHPQEATLVADPAFAKTVDTAVAARLAYAEKLATARVQVAEQLRQEREARQTAQLVALQPGALFLGRAEPLAEGGETIPGLVLEIATVKAPARQLTALLRNEGNWTDTRTFTATWETDADFTTLRLPLATRTTQAVPEAGPLLARSVAWTIELTLDPSGQLAGLSPTHRYTFTRVASGELERTRARLSAAHNAALAATSPGSAYRGTVTAKNGSAPTPALLRFTRQDNGGAKLEAEIELVSQPGRARLFKGLAAANPHRTGTQPIRLLSESHRRIARADVSSVTGLGRDLALALSIDGDTLAGSDEFFEYRFARANAEELGRLSAADQSARAELFASVKRGAAYDGQARHRDGFTTPARLRFTRVDEDGLVEAVIESRQQNGVNLRVAGSIDFPTRTIELTSTGGKPAIGGALRVPFFVLDAKFTLRLALGERTIVGTLEHDNDWSLVFNLGAGAVAVPATLPAWPTASGAHALVGGRWQALPTNNGRPINASSARQSKAAAKDNSAIKVAELVFDGKEPVPVLPAAEAIVLVYVGVVPAPPAAMMEKYGDALRDYPAVELAPARRALLGSKRIADLFRVTPEVSGFHSARVAATLTEPAKEITLFVANTVLAPGNYALLANGAAYELQVR